jgi:hypothetical protein
MAAGVLDNKGWVGELEDVCVMRSCKTSNRYLLYFVEGGEAVPELKSTMGQFA